MARQRHVWVVEQCRNGVWLVRECHLSRRKARAAAAVWRRMILKALVRVRRYVPERPLTGESVWGDDR